MDERDEPLRRRGGSDNTSDRGFTVGRPPAYDAPPSQQQWAQAPSQQQQWAQPPAPPVKRKRTTPLWVTIVVGIAGLVIGTGIGGAGKSTDKTASSTPPAATAGPAEDTATTPATTPAVAPAAPTTKAAPAATQVAPADQGANGDVTLGKFTTDSIGGVTVPVTITNHSSKTSNYLVEFEIDNAAGTKIGDGIASTNNLAPGQKAELDGVGLPSSGTPAKVKLTKVTRYAS